MQHRQIIRNLHQMPPRAKLPKTVRKDVDLYESLVSPNVYGENQLIDRFVDKIYASIQPYGGASEERFPIPDGIRVIDTRIGYLETDIMIKVVDKTSSGHEIEFEQSRWRIIDLSDYREIGGFAEVLMVRKE